jgi:hypothetical protein
MRSRESGLLHTLSLPDKLPAIAGFGVVRMVGAALISRRAKCSVSDLATPSIGAAYPKKRTRADTLQFWHEPQSALVSQSGPIAADFTTNVNSGFEA